MIVVPDYMHEKAEAYRVSREELKAHLRLTMPTVAAMADEFRAVFGEVKVLYAKEGEVEIGNPIPEGVTPILEKP